MSDWILAIDFGTSFTTAAMAGDDGVRLLEIEGSSRMPSMVSREPDGRLLVGREAARAAVMHPERVEATPKRYLGESAPLLLHGGAVDVEEAVGAVLAAVHEAALRAQGGRPPAEVRLTHPAAWRHDRLAALAAAAAHAGIPEVVLLPEPVGAAVHFARDRLARGSLVAVYDLGGGTFDTAVLRRDDEGFVLVGRAGGLDRTGGERFDQALYRHLGEVLARESEQSWFALRASPDAAWRRADADFLAAVRDAKEALSRETTHTFVLGPPLDRSFRVSRGELEELIAQDVGLTVDELERTLGEAGVAPGDLADLYIAGGSSRIPLVARRLAERFGRQPSALDEPKAVVALGAAAADGLGRRWEGRASVPPAQGEGAPAAPAAEAPPSSPGDTPRRADAPAGGSAVGAPRRAVTAGRVASASAVVAGALVVLAGPHPVAEGAGGTLTLWELGRDGGVPAAAVTIAAPIAALLAACAWFASLLRPEMPGRRVLPLAVAVAGGAVAGIPATVWTLWADPGPGWTVPLLAAAAAAMVVAGAAGLLDAGPAPRSLAGLPAALACAGGAGLVVVGSLLEWFARGDDGSLTGTEAGTGWLTLAAGAFLALAALAALGAVARAGAVPAWLLAVAAAVSAGALLVAAGGAAPLLGLADPAAEAPDVRLGLPIAGLGAAVALVSAVAGALPVRGGAR